MERHYFTPSTLPPPDKGAHPNGRKPGDCYLCGHKRSHPVHLKRNGLDDLLRLTTEQQLGVPPGTLNEGFGLKGPGLSLADLKAACEALQEPDPELDFVAIRANAKSVAALKAAPQVELAKSISVFELTGVRIYTDPTLPDGAFVKMNAEQERAWSEGRTVDVQIPDFKTDPPDDDSPNPTVLVTLYPCSDCGWTDGHDIYCPRYEAP